MQAKNDKTQQLFGKHLTYGLICILPVKPPTHLAILCAAIGENRQVCPVLRLRFSSIAAIGIKSPISGMSDIGD